MYVLASQSPRRKELMKRIVDDYIIDVSHIDESSSLYMPPVEATRDIAYRKCLDISQKHLNDIVISADTIVVLDNEIIGKPKDKDDAMKMLHKLSNRTHEVITAFCIYYQHKYYVEHVTSEVTFNVLEDQKIKDYVATGSPLDKAGAYGVQDNEKFHIINNVTGSVDNVVGFPVKEIKETLNKILSK